MTSREEGPTEQTGYTSVTTRIMKGGSQYTTQPLPDLTGQGGHATDTPSNQPAQLRPESGNPTLVPTRVDIEPINPLTVRSVSEPNLQTSTACDNLSTRVAKLTTLTATLSKAPSLMAPRHVFMHDDGANYSTDRNFITTRAPDTGDDMTNVCLPPRTQTATYASRPGQPPQHWPIKVADPDHYTSASETEQYELPTSTASLQLRSVRDCVLSN